MEKGNIKVRKAKLSEYHKISDIRNKTFKKINSKNYTKEQVEVWNKKSTPKRMLEKMNDREFFCLVDKKDNILGSVSLKENMAGNLFIKWNLVGKGFGTKLMEFIEARAKKKGYRKVCLYSTTTALPFYKKRGYKIIKRGKWYIGKVEFPDRKMEKKLK